LLQIKLFGIAEPENMACMIGKVIAAVAMTEDSETTASVQKPVYRLAQHRGRNRDLTRTAGMRADRLRMDPSYRQAQIVADRSAQAAGFLGLIRVEIEVRVVIREILHCRSICQGPAATLTGNAPISKNGVICCDRLR
jgi:hypothetical protein